MAGGNPVYLSDVAEIVDGPPPPSRYVWLGTGPGTPGAAIGANVEFPAVTLAITKKPGESAVDVAARLVGRIAQLQNAVIPEGVEVTVTRNYGVTANDKAMKLIEKLVFATLSVVALALCRARPARGRDRRRRRGPDARGDALRIVGVGLHAQPRLAVRPHLLDRHPGRRRDRGGREHPSASQARSAARRLRTLIPKAVDEVGGPTILATATVIAAVLPIAFVTGMIRPYMAPIPINASMGMVISLGIAFTFTPWLALRLARGDGTAAHGPSRLDAMLANGFARTLTPFLDPTAGRRRRRWLWIGIAAAILLSVSLAVVQWVVLKMLPFDNKSEFQVVVDMPAGTPVEGTAAVLRAMGTYVATVPEVTDYEAYAGTSAPINFNGLVRQYYLRQAPENGDVQVNLVDKHHRDRKSHEIAAAVRPELERIALRFGARVKVVEVPPGPPVLSPLVAEIYGPDERGRHAVAKRVRAEFGRHAEIVGVDDSIEDSAPKTQVRVDQARAASLGVAPADIVAAMRVALDGDDVTMLHDAQAKYGVPVRLTLPAERQAKLDGLLAMKVRGSDGALVPLSELVQARTVDRDRTDPPQGSAAGLLRDRRCRRQDRQSDLRHVRGARRDAISSWPRSRDRSSRLRQNHPVEHLAEYLSFAQRLVVSRSPGQRLGRLRQLPDRRRPDSVSGVRRRDGELAERHDFAAADYHQPQI